MREAPVFHRFCNTSKKAFGNALPEAFTFVRLAGAGGTNCGADRHFLHSWPFSNLTPPNAQIFALVLLSGELFEEPLRDDRLPSPFVAW